MGYRIAIDTGGTFTDLVLADEQGNMYSANRSTTFERIFDGIEGAFSMVAEQLGTESPQCSAKPTSDLRNDARDQRDYRGKTARPRCW